MYYPKLPEEYEEENTTSDALPTREIRVLKGHEGPVLAVRYNSAGTYCLSCGKDRNVRLWNPQRGLLVKTYEGHGHEVRDATVAQDNAKFASCGGDKQVFLWDVGTGRFIRKFRGHDAAVNAVTYAAGDEVLVTGGYDQAIKVWDCRSRALNPMQAMRDFKDSVTCVAVHEWHIIGGSVDGSIRRYDVRMGRAYADELTHPVTSVCVSRDGLCVLAACCDSALRLLDREGGDLLASYLGHVHTGVKMDCALTPSDAHVVGASESGEVLFWDLVDARVVARMAAHGGPVTSLAMHKGGRAMLTASVDGAIKVWGDASAAAAAAAGS